MNPFDLWDAWVEACEEAINAVIEPMIDAYWAWEWENVKREMDL